MTDLIVYYGTSMPDSALARTVTNTDVVLQPYHPVVSQGGYRQTFPNTRRFVYVNPTSIDPWRLERAAVKPPVLDIDDDWSLPRLDLTDAAGWRAAIDEAVWALSSGPEEIHGVFIDDLDRVDTTTAYAFVEELQEALGWSPQLFVNRGFHAWSGLSLQAVLIEDVRGGFVAEDDPAGLSRWVAEAMVPALVDVRTQGTAVHRIEYLDTSKRNHRLEDQLATDLFDSAWMTAPRSLDDWPSHLKKNKDETK